MEDEHLSLEPERLNEITFIALKTFYEFDLYEDKFDIVKILKQHGITAIPYSSFEPESLKQMHAFSTSFWSEGLFCRSIDKDGKEVKIIAFDDSKSKEEILSIIFHELAHCELKHTQQCIIGELEASSFSTALLALVYMLKDLFAPNKKNIPFNKQQLIKRLESFFKPNKEVKRCSS